MDENTIRLSLDGFELDDPGNLLRLLSKKLDRKWLTALENRVNTMGVHSSFDISWGIAGMADRYRNQSLAFLDPESPYGDAEQRILAALRLSLWRTPWLAKVRSGGKLSGHCRCGAKGTIQHYLNVPKDKDAHSEELRAVPQARHRDWVQAVGDWVLLAPTTGRPWLAMNCEHQERAEDCEFARVAIDKARGEGILRNGGEDTQQHWKPDLLLARRRDNTEWEFAIVDICSGADRLLQLEDEITTA